MAKVKSSKKGSANQDSPDIDEKAKAPEAGSKNAPREYDPTMSYSEGEVIVHKNWDDVGEIKEVGTTNDGLKKIKVQFGKVGIKTLIMDHRAG